MCGTTPVGRSSDVMHRSLRVPREDDQSKYLPREVLSHIEWKKMESRISTSIALNLWMVSDANIWITQEYT